VHGELPPGQTRRLLKTVPAAYGTQITETLLAPLALTLTEWTHAPFVAVDLEGHGREDLGSDIDVSRTVGWFTTICPVVVGFDGGGRELGEALKQTKERLREVPRRGLGHGVLRHLASHGLDEPAPAEVALNYLGQVDRGQAGGGRFRPLPGSLGPDRAPRGPRGHLIELDCRVVDDRLELTWTYSAQVHARATVERLANRYLDVLNALIDHCCDPAAGGYTPSDFPLAGLDQATLDQIQQRLDATLGGRS